MPETSDTYRTPETTIELVDNARVDIHEKPASTFVFEKEQLAERALSLAIPIRPEQPMALSIEPQPPVEPTREIPTLATVIELSRKLVDSREYKLDGQLDIFSDNDKSSPVLPKIISKAQEWLTGSDTISPLLKFPKKRSFKAVTERELIQKESEIGSQLFDAVPVGDRREFFCVDASTWIWYEEAQDVETGKQISTTTRYELHNNGILKAQDGAQYSYLEGDELANLSVAIERYYDDVMNQLYQQDPQPSAQIAA